MSAMAGKAVGFMAMVPLEAFLTVTMPLAFSDKNEGARSVRYCMSRRVAATGNAPAGGVASANENIKAKRKRFVMFPPNRCDSRNSWRDAPPTRPMNSRRFIYPRKDQASCNT
jgi:hypothetical protein